MRYVGPVGIAVPDKVRPVPRRQFRQLAIGVFVQPREYMEIVEHIEKLARMKSAGVATVALSKPTLRRQRSAIEAEAKNVGASALLLRLDPGPSRWMMMRSPPSARADSASVSGDPPG